MLTSMPTLEKKKVLKSRTSASCLKETEKGQQIKCKIDRVKEIAVSLLLLFF